MAPSVAYRRYLTARSESGGEIKYVSIDKVLNDPDLQSQVIDKPLLAKINRVRESSQPTEKPKVERRK
jgi:hypothetical protein